VCVRVCVCYVTLHTKRFVEQLTVLQLLPKILIFKEHITREGQQGLFYSSVKSFTFIFLEIPLTDCPVIVSDSLHTNCFSHHEYQNVFLFMVNILKIIHIQLLTYHTQTLIYM